MKRDALQWDLRWNAGLLCLILLSGLGACEGRGGGDGVPSAGGEAPRSAESEAVMPRRSIEQVQEEYTPALMTIDGVVGTYIGRTDAGEPCIKIMVRQRTSDLEARLPDALEGYPVEIVESGEIRPLPGTNSP